MTIELLLKRLAKRKGEALACFAFGRKYFALVIPTEIRFKEIKKIILN